MPSSIKCMHYFSSFPLSPSFSLLCCFSLSPLSSLNFSISRFSLFSRLLTLLLLRFFAYFRFSRSIVLCVLFISLFLPQFLFSYSIFSFSPSFHSFDLFISSNLDSYGVMMDQKGNAIYSYADFGAIVDRGLYVYNLTSSKFISCIPFYYFYLFF